jgi:signal transduction histidine kinase
VRIEARFVGDEIEVFMSNYGVGILPDELHEGKVFEDGYQGKLRQGEYRTGSGKGLSFVHSVIQRHHGRIQIKSELQAEEEPDPGGKQPYLTLVTVRIPRKQA